MNYQWLLIHTHRFGRTVFVFTSNTSDCQELPELPEIAKAVDADYEGDEGREYLEVEPAPSIEEAVFIPKVKHHQGKQRK